MSDSPINRLLDTVAWQPTGATGDDSGLPYATHEGVLTIAGVSLRVYQLNDGRRIVDADDFERFFAEATEGEGRD